jgi:PPOX class probable F420-dependent enzyme
MALLPLAPTPFTAPTDRDMLPSERREFVRSHRTCVFGTTRRADGPAMSIVYYVPTDDDDLLISTMAGRSKAKVAARDGRASLCVLDERWPFAYLQVYCRTQVVTDAELTVDVMMAVAARMSGEALGEDARPFVQAMAEEEERVVIRCSPYETFAQPPRHLHHNDQSEQVTHWTSPGSLAWDAPDPTDAAAATTA